MGSLPRNPPATVPGRLVDPVLLGGQTRQHVQQQLTLCRSLGIVINEEKSDLSPSRSVEYVGMIIGTVSARAFPTKTRIQKFLSLAKKFLSQPNPPAQRWQVLLGHMSSLEKLVPRARLQMWSLQWHLKSSWSTENEPPHTCRYLGPSRWTGTSLGGW